MKSKIIIFLIVLIVVTAVSYFLYTNPLFVKNIIALTPQSASGAVTVSRGSSPWQKVVDTANFFVIASGNNKIVIGGTGGLLVSSDNGKSWDSIATDSHMVDDIVYANGKFCSTAWGNILVSSDGITWEKHEELTTFDQSIGMKKPHIMEGMTYGNNIFIAVGYDGVAISKDGNKWELKQINEKYGVLKSVCWGNGKFVAVGTQTITTSADGINWVHQAAPPNIYEFKKVIYARNMFVAVGSGGSIITSPDGINWQVEKSNTSKELQGITWGNNKFIAVGNPGRTILTSTDGHKWDVIEDEQNIGYYGKGLNCVTWTGDRFIATGWNGLIISSSDGLKWDYLLNPPDFLALKNISWNGQKYIAIDERTNNVVSSSDGISWQSQKFKIDDENFPALSEEEREIDDIIWANNQFWAVGARGIILTSPDGFNWHLNTKQTNQTQRLSSIAWSGSKFVAVGRGQMGMDGKIIMSEDGENWFIGDSQYPNIEKVRWIKDKFWAVGDDGIIISSSDGDNWDKKEIPIASNTAQYRNLVFYDIAYDGKQFVIAGGKYILSSPDGESWTIVAEQDRDYVRHIVWSGSKFVAVGDAGVILSSNDGKNWAKDVSNTNEYLEQIIWSGNRFVIVGNNIILVSK